MKRRNSSKSFQGIRENLLDVLPGTKSNDSGEENECVESAIEKSTVSKLFPGPLSFVVCGYCDCASTSRAVDSLQEATERVPAAHVG